MSLDCDDELLEVPTRLEVEVRHWCLLRAWPTTCWPLGYAMDIKSFRVTSLRGAWPWASSLIPMGLSCFTYKLGIIIGLYEDLQHLLATAESLQLCPTLCNPMDCSPPGSSVHEIPQARILEWVAISFPRGSTWPRDRTHFPCLLLLHWQVASLQLMPLGKPNIF